MSKVVAGAFEIYVSDPYPAWISLSYGTGEICMFHHKELSDLKYAVEKAMQIARHKLPENEKGEV